MLSVAELCDLSHYDNVLTKSCRTTPTYANTMTLTAVGDEGRNACTSSNPNCKPGLIDGPASTNVASTATSPPPSISTGGPGYPNNQDTVHIISVLRTYNLNRFMTIKGVILPMTCEMWTHISIITKITPTSYTGGSRNV